MSTTKLALKYVGNDMVPDDIKAQQVEALPSRQKCLQNVLKWKDNVTLNPEMQRRILNAIKQQRRIQHSQDTTSATCKVCET